MLLLQFNLKDIFGIHMYALVTLAHMCACMFTYKFWGTYKRTYKFWSTDEQTYEFASTYEHSHKFWSTYYKRSYVRFLPRAYTSISPSFFSFYSLHPLSPCFFGSLLAPVENYQFSRKLKH